MRRHFHLVAWVALLACGCGPSAEPDVAEAPSESEEGVDTEPTQHHDESGDSESDPLPQSPPDADATGPAHAQASGPAAFNIETWSTERGVEAKLDDVERCEPAAVGDKPDQALWCWRGKSLPKSDFEARFIALYVIRGQTLAKAFELQLAVGLAREEGGKVEPLVELAPRVEDEGKTVIFSESGPSCEDALARADADHPDEPAASKAKRTVINDVCRKRGRYRWAAGTLRRVGPP